MEFDTCMSSEPTQCHAEIVYWDQELSYTCDELGYVFYDDWEPEYYSDEEGWTYDDEWSYGDDWDC
jgi:hypothetical protein